MSDVRISFLTPYWNGKEMMAVHLQSIRAFYSSAPILVSKKGGNKEEMEEYRREYGVEFELEDLSYYDALFALLRRCRTEYVCVMDHDAVLLSSLDSFIDGLSHNLYDLVGVEERIRESPGIDWQTYAPEFAGWLRLAPGHVACNFIVFNLRQFVARWGLRGVLHKSFPWSSSLHHELDYGIGQRLKRHKYLLPYHSRKYGLGNLLMDGDRPIAWHQWFGSHRERLSGEAGEIPEAVAARIAMVERGENAFLADYPNLDLSDATAAWGPERDAEADFRALLRLRPNHFSRLMLLLGRLWGYGPRGIVERIFLTIERRRRLR